MKVVFVGFTWWGPGCEDFRSFSMKNDTRSLRLADLGRPLSRRLIHSPLLYESRVRMLSAVYGRSSKDLVVILSPHRISKASVRLLRRKAGAVVAWVGDDPVGIRSFDHSIYDRVFAADASWIANLPNSYPTSLPWPHFVPSDYQLPPRNSCATLAMIGTAYENRIAFARELECRGVELTVVGNGYPTDVPALKPMGRLDTLSFLQNTCAYVLNVPHPQMRNTRNPFFFDLAAAGIPQILVSNTEVEEGTLLSKFDKTGLPSPEFEKNLIKDTLVLQQDILTNHTVDSRLEAIWKEVQREL